MSYPFEWRRRERHENAINRLLVELGFRDDQGRIRKYVGSVFLPEAIKIGHSTFGFDSCSCRLPPEDKGV